LSKKKVAIIGGGASGLTAALFASDRCDVTLFEKQKKAGRKILVTGNGRCNISNRYIESSRYHGNDRDFANHVFSRFGPGETGDFFKSIGIPFVEEKDGKLFPASLQSSIIPKVFSYELSKRNVTVNLHRRIDKIITGKEEFKLITAGNERHEFDSVILACGSCAHPASGASKSGYHLAETLGHKIYEPFPVILPINISYKPLHRLQGIKQDCRIKAILDGKTVAEAEDEILFTGYGISGPASLKISRKINELILDNKSPEISINLFPGMDKETLLPLLNILWTDSGKKVSFSLLGILKERLPEVILEIAGIDSERRSGTLTDKEKLKIADTLMDLRLTPGSPRGFEEAVAAAGGVATADINPLTMESKIVKGLYITGELLDIDGDSGGFNLQFAWSTGAIAGLSQ
jgi:predicted Rossmann fold flavoprotein